MLGISLLNRHSVLRTPVGHNFVASKSHLNSYAGHSWLFFWFSKQLVFYCVLGKVDPSDCLVSNTGNKEAQEDRNRP